MVWIMYRYIALQNNKQGEGPLKQYFLGETTQKAGVGIFEANMHLAEDRVSLPLVLLSVVNLTHPTDSMLGTRCQARWTVALALR
jgi:hypothetical protein